MKMNFGKEAVPEQKISMIICNYNIASEIDGLYQSAVKAAEQISRPFEIVFVDDGSTDHSYDRLRAIADEDPRVRVLRMRSSFGEAASLEAGLKHSNGQQVVFISARVRVDLMRLPEFFEKFTDDVDLVVGWRYPRRDGGMNRLISWFFNRMAGRIAKIRLHDINSGVFVARREMLERLSFYGDLHNFIPVLAAQQGYQVAESKIEQKPGKFRRSKYPKEYVQRVLDIITVFFLSRYSKKPIHFLGFLGSLLMLSGLAILAYLFFYRVLQFGPIAGRPLLLLGAMLLVIGIQMISIGLLGEMVIFTHAGDIEEYNIEEIIN